eukprot:775333-Pleurochrysis_carterae.AAC.5
MILSSYSESTACAANMRFCWSPAVGETFYSRPRSPSCHTCLLCPWLATPFNIWITSGSSEKPPGLHRIRIEAHHPGCLLVPSEWVRVR